MTFYPKKLLLYCIPIIACHISYAQGGLSKSLNINNAYNRGTRSDSGNPGSKYWQNTASYHIKVNFDPQSRNLGGTVEVERGRAGHGDTSRHVARAVDTVRAGHGDRLARRGGLDGVNDVSPDVRSGGQRDGGEETELFTAVGC